MEIRLLLLMVLCHILDDFVLQPICLSKLKQKDWWLKQEGYCKKYEDDYKMALAIHSISWSIMILLPSMFLFEISNIELIGYSIVNAIFHYMIDNAKANKRMINLIEDQLAHLFQIMFTWIALVN